MVTAILIVSLLFSVSCYRGNEAASNMSEIGLNLNKAKVPDGVTLTKYCLTIKPSENNKDQDGSTKIGSDCPSDSAFKALDDTSLKGQTVKATGEYALALYIKCTKKNSTKEELCYKTPEARKFDTLTEDKATGKSVAISPVKIENLVLSSTNGNGGSVTAEGSGSETETGTGTGTGTGGSETETETPPTDDDIIVEATIVDPASSVTPTTTK